MLPNHISSLLIQSRLRKPRLYLLVATLAVVGCATVRVPTIESHHLENPDSYDFSHPQARFFVDKLYKSLSTSVGRVEIEDVAHQFVDLPRSEIPRSDLFEIKFRYQHWRHVVYGRILDAIVGSGDPAALQERIDALGALSLSSDVEDLLLIYESTQSWTESSNYRTLITSYADLVMLQGDTRITDEVIDKKLPLLGAELEVTNTDGPEKRIRIPPSYKSNWPFERWSKYESFSHYARTADGVMYRGIEFLPGDTLIVNLQNPSEGLFTVVLEGRNYSPHMAIYIDVEAETGSFPAVYEIHQVGVRLVPLHIFLSDSVSSYIEVFRHRDAPRDWRERFSSAALQILTREQGFNLFADELHSDGSHYLTCVTAVQHLVESSGIYPSYPAQTDVSPGTLVHVAPLGFESLRYHSPTDFLTWDQFELVGVVDNGGYLDDIARQLVNERLSQRMAESTLRLDSGAYRIFRWASGLVLRQVPVVAPLLRSAFGYTKGNFPMGTKELLAFMELIQIDINKSVANLKPGLEELLSDYTTTDSFSIHSLIEDPGMQSAVDESVKPLNRWFAESASALP